MAITKFMLIYFRDIMVFDMVQLSYYNKWHLILFIWVCAKHIRIIVDLVLRSKNEIIVSATLIITRSSLYAKHFGHLVFFFNTFHLLL